MIVKIGGIEYECRTAKAEENKVILYTGKYDEDGDEIVSCFYGFRTEDIEGLENEVKPTQLDIIEAQITYTAMMTDTLLEV